MVLVAGASPGPFCSEPGSNSPRTPLPQRRAGKSHGPAAQPEQRRLHTRTGVSISNGSLGSGASSPRAPEHPRPSLGLRGALVRFTELRFSNESGRRMVLGRTGWERPSRIAELGLLLPPASCNDPGLERTERCLKTSRVPGTAVLGSGRASDPPVGSREAESGQQHPPA